MQVIRATTDDFDRWIALAREVEPLFGPMADEPGFREGLRKTILAGNAYCIRTESESNGLSLPGGIIISTKKNKIAWLAVSKQFRGQGYGRLLLEHAIGRLDRSADILVQTFSESVPGGQAARNLYMSLGFTDQKDAGLNPAGVQTVIMCLSPNPV